MSNVEYSFLVCILAGLSTLLGSFLIFFKKQSTKVLAGSLSFAAGVMITVSLTDLIPSSFSLLSETYFPVFSILLVALFFVVGVIFSMLVDKYLPEEKGKNGLYRVGIFSMIAIILHNIPEDCIYYVSQ